MRNKATPRRLRLPAIPAGHLYQLIHHGKINTRREDTDQYELELHFVEKGPGDGFRKPLGQVRACKINLADSYEFILGSLWEVSGEKSPREANRVSAGLYLADKNRRWPHRILPDTYSFLSATERYSAQQLNSLLPPALIANTPALRASFLSSIPDTWVITHRLKHKTIIIPCFELLRVLYYEAGRATIDLFWSKQPLAATCSVIAAPTAANGRTGHVSIRRGMFSEAQQCILAELCLNAKYLHTVTETHSDLTLALRDHPAGAYPRVDLHLGHRVRFQANGFHFKVGEENYFLACGLWPLSNPFSFEHLVVDLPTGQRAAAAERQATQASLLEEARRGLLRADTRQNPALDSLEPAGRRYGEATVLLHPRSGIGWPHVAYTPGKQSKRDSRSPSFPGSQTLEGLSYTEGGDDETRGLVSGTEVLDGERQLTPYFQEFISWFRQRGDYRIELLTLYNEDGRHGASISTLGPGDGRGIAVAELRHAKGHFYFLELLTGGRAAFLHKRRPTLLTQADFVDLFDKFRESGLNWLTYKKSLAEEEEERDVPRKRELTEEFVISPRNHHNGGIATALLCEKYIRQLLSF